MITIPADRLNQEIDAVLQTVSSNVGVVVCEHGEVAGYLVSPTVYEHLQRLRATAPRALDAGDLSQRDVKDLEGSRMRPRHTGLDGLLDE